MSQIKVEGLRHVYSAGTPFERVAIDGISLTVAKITDRDFSISAIPHTVAQTVLSERKEGDSVNLETDIIGKYVEKLLRPAEEPAGNGNGGACSSGSGITREFLTKYGF